MDRWLPENWFFIRGLPPYKRGLTSSLVLMLILTAISAAVFATFHVRAEAEVLRTLAVIGATLLVAYEVIASTIILKAQVESRDKRQERLGALVGIGASGMIGIANALVLSERTCVDNPGLLEELAFAWTAASLLMFLVFVAFQADAIDSWAEPPKVAGRSRWLTRNRRRPN
jgi:cation transport ATPase